MQKSYEKIKHLNQNQEKTTENSLIHHFISQSSLMITSFQPSIDSQSNFKLILNIKLVKSELKC